MLFILIRVSFYQEEELRLISRIPSFCQTNERFVMAFLRLIVAQNLTKIFTLNTIKTKAAQALAFSLCAQFTSAQDVELIPVVVNGNRYEPTGHDDVEESKRRVEATPGGASIVTPEDWTGRTLTTQDIFQFDPGVSARSRGVGTDARISVRGSGIQRQFGDRGVSLFIDGIPLNDSDGSFYFRAIDPLVIDHVETYRGGNGLPYGGSQLGGAIRLVQKNGRTAPGGLILGEYGSFDTYRGAIQYGLEEGPWDFFGSYTYSETDGFRERSASRSNFLNSSLGYKWSEQSTTRFYLHYSDSDAELSGSLTLDQLAEDPSQAGSDRTDEADRDLATFRFGQRTEWDTESGSWSFFTSFQALDFDHLINEGLFRFNRFIDYNTLEGQIGLQGEQRYQALGQEQTFRLYASGNYGVQDEDGFGGFVTPGNPADNFARTNTAWNIQAFLDHDLHFAEGHHLITGVGFNHADRERDLSSADSTGDNEFNTSDTGLTYRLGYLFELDPSTQFFTNFSQSFEGSPFSEAEDALNPQIGRTWEIGARYKNDLIEGEVTYYYSDIKDEFVDVELGSGFSQTTNLDTVHQGVEFALTADLAKLVGVENYVRLFWDQKYQYNDFTIEGGPDEGNRLPGVSEQVFNSRVRLQSPDDKWRLALSADWLPQGFVVDNENTLETDGFVNFRLSGEVKLTDNVQLYGGIDNLFDETFANNVTINPSGDDFVDPGDGRSFYAGLKYQW